MRIIALLMALTLSACQSEHGSGQAAQVASGPASPSSTPLAYQVLNGDFDPLRAAFNAAKDDLRLVFLVGPTCGICLRGMAELQESLNAQLSHPRLQTFVVHLPVLGADEDDVLPAAQLLAHGNVHHYWDPEGRLGLRYAETFDTNVYAWDMWFIYVPGQTWDEDEAPPMPDFWMHQLRSFPDEKYLDAEVFADEIQTRLVAIESRPATSPEAVSIVGVRISEVLQPRGVGVQNAIIGRGGYANLKRLERVEMHGRTEWHGQAQPLSVVLTRDSTVRQVGSGQIRFDGQELTRSGVPDSLPMDLESALISTLSLGGPFLNWPDRGHRLEAEMDAEQMENGLAWVIRRTHQDGSRWQHYIHLRSGSEVRRDLLDEDDHIRYTIRYSDFRNADGFSHEPQTYSLGRQRFELTGMPYPHLVEYFTPDGELIARDVLDWVTVSVNGPTSG